MFVTLFNLQGAHRFQRRAFILPQLFSFVKHFFQVFSNFFVLSFAGLSPCFAVLADSLIRLPHSVSFVKHFFKFFQTFLCFSRNSRWLPLSFQTAYRGYHLSDHLSSTFFKFSKLIFKRRTRSILGLFPQPPLPQGFLCPAPEALAYNSKIPLACQHLFSSFLIFFSLPHIFHLTLVLITRYALLWGCVASFF